MTASLSRSRAPFSVLASFQASDALVRFLSRDQEQKERVRTNPEEGESRFLFRKNQRDATGASSVERSPSARSFSRSLSRLRRLSGRALLGPTRAAPLLSPLREEKEIYASPFSSAEKSETPVEGFSLYSFGSIFFKQLSQPHLLLLLPPHSTPRPPPKKNKNKKK